MSQRDGSAGKGTDNLAHIEKEETNSSDHQTHSDVNTHSNTINIDLIATKLSIFRENLTQPNKEEGHSIAMMFIKN